MYYIYCHIDPNTGNVFYVGKGKNGRAYSIGCRNNHHLNKLRKLQREGFSIKKDVVQYLETNIKSQDEAYKKEIYYIAKLNKHYNLLNIAPGGMGGIGNSGKFGIDNPNWVDVDVDKVIKYLKQGLAIKDIGNILGCSAGLIKQKCYPNTKLSLFCKNNNIPHYNHMAKLITEYEFQSQLKQGKSNKDIAKHFCVNLSFFKRKFYPNMSLQEYCKFHNILYANPQVGEKNGNYKELDFKVFENLVKRNTKLKEIAAQLNISMRALIKKYKEYYNVGSWLELKYKLQS